MHKPWTIADIPDQTGRTTIVTGGNSGIGYYAALELARKGATIVLACRSVAKAKDAAASIRRAAPPAQIEVAALDLASQASIHDFAAQYLGSGRPLDLLINNAGVMALPKRLETKDGFEMQFGTNVLGHFALTGLLLSAMEATAKTSAQAPRIVTLASIAHKTGKIELSDLQSEVRYSPMVAYQQSKLGDLMFALELDRRLRAKGSRVESIAAHPGVAQTNLFTRDCPQWQVPFRKLLMAGVGLLLNSGEQGAWPTLYAATSAEAHAGGYYGPQGFQEMRGLPGEAHISAGAQDAQMAGALFERCEQLTGVRMP